MRIRDMIGTMVPKKKGETVQLYSEWGLHVLGAREDKDYVPLPEYPRPQFVRENYKNLNGWWDYRIAPASLWDKPGEFFSGEMDGKILVPFSPETELSGVGRILQPDEELWYQRAVNVPVKKDGRLLLHFGAVDQSCMVYWNTRKVGAHLGGYLPFTVDVTDAVTEGENLLSVLVMDVSDTSYHARGKQALKPEGIWYTPQSGIWQTVWMEWVPALYMKDTVIRADADTGNLSVNVRLSDIPQAPVPARLNVYEDGRKAASCEGKTVTVTRRSGGRSGEVRFETVIPRPHKWSAEDPFLYTLELSVGDDYAESYTAFRIISLEKDKTGYKRVCINHEPVFLNGLLDQGYWPDGLYTAPTDEALASDIVRMKALGFNLLRKHIKIEPARWYYHCDRLGMYVWQDMVNGGDTYETPTVAWAPTLAKKLSGNAGYSRKGCGRLDEDGCREWLAECRQTVKLLQNVPSVIGWVPFNEGWGQFETERVTEMVRRLDPTRTIDAASGWFDFGTGDFRSVHNYFSELVIPEDDHDRARVISEYGGVSCPVDGHVYRSVGTYGYEHLTSGAAFRERYEALQARVKMLAEAGLAGAVYTQVSDVEEETNGLLTYDRRVNKVLPKE